VQTTRYINVHDKDNKKAAANSWLFLLDYDWLLVGFGVKLA